MQHIKILKAKSLQAINLRLKGHPWEGIKLENKYILELRKSNVYLNCVIEKVNSIGLNFFKQNAIKEDVPLHSYLSQLFGLGRRQIGFLIHDLNIDTFCKFEWTSGGRKIKWLEPTNDCAVRTFVSVFDITYEQAIQLCKENQFFSYDQNPLIKGVSDYAIRKVFRSKGWDYLNDITNITKNEMCLEDLFSKCLPLMKEKLVIFTSGHIFYVDQGVIKDTWNDSFAPIDTIFCEIKRQNIIEQLISRI